MAKISQQVSKSEVKDTLLEQFKSALRSGTPVISLTTADQPATVSRLVSKINGNRAFIAWDCVTGFVPLNELARKALPKFCPQPADTTLCQMAIMDAMKAEDNTVILIYNAQLFLTAGCENFANTVQAVCNIRDVFKSKQCALVLLSPQMRLPIELSRDVISLDEPLPAADQLGKIVRDLHDAASIEAAPEVVSRAVEAVQGLSAFQAEQVTAMNFQVEDGKITGLDLDALWDSKRKQIAQTPGLSINREGYKFADLGGLKSVKGYMGDLLQGSQRPNAIVFIDEIEKVMAGAAGDTSGVSQDQHRCLLTEMENRKYGGAILVGHAGSGKSALAKAMGNEAGIPTITLDLGGTKGGIVGQSESQLRDALKVIDAVSNGNSLWIATSNNINSISPELQRRFTEGVFFFDLPDREEKDAIWKVHRAAFKIKASDEQPNDTGWTGAEIERCCRKADRLNKPLLHAAKFIVPVSQSAPETIERLRTQADGRWLSASHEGVYRKESDAQQLAVAPPAQRKLGIL